MKVVRDLFGLDCARTPCRRTSRISWLTIAMLVQAASCGGSGLSSPDGGQTAGQGGTGGQGPGGRSGGDGGRGGGSAGTGDRGGTAGTGAGAGGQGGASGGAGSGAGSGGSGATGGTAGVGALRVQMNDVSLLFPLDDSAYAGDGYLKAGSTGAHGALLPSALYDTIGHVTGSSGALVPGGDKQAAYGDLRVVAARLDPCFAALAPDPHGAGCKNQLRLIMQELTNPAGKVAAYDSALHLFYSLSRDELLDVAQSIANLRRAVSGDQRLGALAPHPIMKQQGLGGSMAAGLRALILQHAGQDNLVRVTKMSSFNTGFSWRFGGFDVVTATPVKVQPMVIPTLPTSATEQVFFHGFAKDIIQGTFTPATMGPDDLTVLADATKASQSRPAVDSAFAALVRIDHPAKSSPDTVDCASCHLATPLSTLVALPKFSLDERKDANAYVPHDGTSVSAADLLNTFNSVPVADVHAFSYVGVDPSINQRTVNETAAIVEYLNTP